MRRKRKAMMLDIWRVLMLLLQGQLQQVCFAARARVLTVIVCFVPLNVLLTITWTEIHQ